MRLTRASTGGLYAGLLYVGLFGLVCLLPPDSLPVRLALARSLLLLPPIAAAAACVRAARASSGSEWGFWGLLGLSAGASAVTQAVCLVHETLAPAVPELRLFAHLFECGAVVALAVGLAVRPDRPLGPRELRAASIEWLIAWTVGFFAVVYFAVLPVATSGALTLGPAARHAAPALIAVFLALRVADDPFRTAYRTLAAGLMVAVGLGALAAWSGHSADRPLQLWDVGRAAPFWGLLVAAGLPRGPTWMRSVSALRDAGGRRAGFAALLVAVPPLTDLGMAVAAGSPTAAGLGTAWALACAAALAVLAAARLRVEVGRPESLRPGDDEGEARRALGEPTESSQFASGVAHELNNPLMAVAGWAELALRKGAPREPVERLIEAARRAADVVARLQRVERGAQGGG